MDNRFSSPAWTCILPREIMRNPSTSHLWPRHPTAQLLARRPASVRQDAVLPLQLAQGQLEPGGNGAGWHWKMGKWHWGDMVQIWWISVEIWIDFVFWWYWCGLLWIDTDWCGLYNINIYAFILINMTMGSESTGNQCMERWVNVNESGLIWIHMGHMG